MIVVKFFVETRVPCFQPALLITYISPPEPPHEMASHNPRINDAQQNHRRQRKLRRDN